MRLLRFYRRLKRNMKTHKWAKLSDKIKWSWIQSKINQEDK